jgi:hypothetical protein
VTEQRVSDSWDCPRCHRAPKHSNHVCANLPPPSQQEKDLADLRAALAESDARCKRLEVAGKELLAAHVEHASEEPMSEKAIVRVGLAWAALQDELAESEPR